MRLVSGGTKLTYYPNSYSLHEFTLLIDYSMKQGGAELYQAKASLYISQVTLRFKEISKIYGILNFSI